MSRLSQGLTVELLFQPGVKVCTQGQSKAQSLVFQRLCGFSFKFVTTLAELRGELGFRIGGDDAKTLTRESATIQPASSFQDLSDYKTFVRTMSAEPGRPDHPQGPITVKTFPPFGCQGTENDKAPVIETSLRRNSRPRAEVDASLNRFLSPT